jgi:GTP-binding protein Era
VPELLKTIVAYLPQGPRFYPPEQVSDMRVRDMVAEIIREAVLFATQDEVPHSVATLVEEFKERENGVVYISAQLYVERDSQKKILIGKQGQMIKNISTRARQAVEKMLEKKVYLELRVKVMKNWRRDEQMLTRLGYRLGQR